MSILEFNIWVICVVLCLCSVRLCIHVIVYVCAYMSMCVCATALPWWQGVSIMINRQTRRLSHAITLHYGSQDFKVKMNGSSSTWRLHISSFFCFFSLFYFLEETCLFLLSCEDHLCFCHCLKCMVGHMDSEKNKSFPSIIVYQGISNQ